MKNSILICLLFSISQTFAQSFIPFQPTKVGMVAGTSLYHGDICPNLDCGFGSAGLLIGGQVQYHIMKKWYFTPQVYWHRFQGDDANGANPERNLSFRSDNFSFNFNTIYYLGDYHDYKSRGLNLHPFVGLGLGGIFFNPQANLNGEWVALQPFQTEGINYSRFSPTINPSLGFAWRINKSIEIKLIYSYGFTFTDYLDDVSGEYTNNNDLVGDAATLADRSFEGGAIPSESVDGEHWAAGSSRGNSNGPDSYSSIMIGVSFSIVKKVRTN